MEIKEFEKRTGYFPTTEEYKTIEKFYMNFDGDKDEFCEAYKKNEGFIAEKIQREANLERLKSDSETSEKIKAAQEEIEKLKKDLEREQEWKPYNDAENVSQCDYASVAGCCRVHDMIKLL